MRGGGTTSRTERGTGSDIGLHRLTFHHDGHIFRTVIDAEDRIPKRLRFIMPARKPAAGNGR